MEYIRFWEANNNSASQNSPPCMEAYDSLRSSQERATGLFPVPD
jgi:hypothetical protein